MRRLRMITSCPSFRREAVRAFPRKPEPPAIKTFITNSYNKFMTLPEAHFTNSKIQQYNRAYYGDRMHEPVLVLNANFEPINVCTTRRAVGLLLAGKADMVVNGRGHIRTVKEL